MNRMETTGEADGHNGAPYSNNTKQPGRENAEKNINRQYEERKHARHNPR